MKKDDTLMNIKRSQPCNRPLTELCCVSDAMRITTYKKFERQTTCKDLTDIYQKNTELLSDLKIVSTALQIQ